MMRTLVRGLVRSLARGKQGQPQPPDAPWADLASPWDKFSAFAAANAWDIRATSGTAFAQALSVPLPDGKWYIEARVTIEGNWSEVGGVGVLAGDTAPSDFIGSYGQEGAALYPSGGTGDWYLGLWRRGDRTYAADTGTVAAGAVTIGIAVDTATRSAWLRAGLAGGVPSPWVNPTNSASDPATGVGPAIILDAGAIRIGASTNKAGDAVGLSKTLFHAPPAGFLPLAASA